VRTERDLLEAILFPSASFVRSYEPIIVENVSGDLFSGILKKDAADEIVLGTGPGAEVRLARSEIKEVRPGSLSLMPQGLDAQLTAEQLADLVAFLKATRW
jgi:putative heme-binding domain-containing protein